MLARSFADFCVDFVDVVIVSVWGLIYRNQTQYLATRYIGRIGMSIALFASSHDPNLSSTNLSPLAVEAIIRTLSIKTQPRRAFASSFQL